MKSTIKKIFQSAILLAVFSSSIFAFDWGGILKNETGISAPEFSGVGYNQADSLYLWLNAPLSEDGLVYFSTEGLYKISINKAPKADTVVSNYVDMDLFKFAGDWELNSGFLSFAAGRFMTFDTTGVIFAQTSDGVSIKYSSAIINLAAYAGYTGLLNGLTVTMLDGNNIAYTSDKKMYALVHPYLPFNATIEFPSLIGNQSLSLQTNGFVDVKPASKNENGSRFYETLILSGPITNSLFYNAATILGVASKKLMNYSSLDMYFYPLNNLSVNAGVEYASGNNGPFSSFVTFTSRTVANSNSYPITTGVIIPKLGTSLLFENSFLGLNAKLLMACPESEVSAKGIETDFSWAYNIFSDLQLSCSVAGYFDISGNKSDNNLTATLSVAVAF